MLAGLNGFKRAVKSRDGNEWAVVKADNKVSLKLLIDGCRLPFRESEDRALAHAFPAASAE